MLTELEISQIVDLLLGEVYSVQSIYLFGSQATGESSSDSDVDLAIYANSDISNDQIWNCKFKIAELINREVDLIDLSTATTVLQFQVISTGSRLFAADENIDWFESKVYWNYLTLNEDRQMILDDIAKTGKVYG